MSASEFAAAFPSPEMLAVFEEIYHATHRDSIAPLEGIPELLAALRDEGMRLAVVSLKPRRAGELELDLCDLRPYLETAVWGDDGPPPKPSPDAALEAAARLGVDPSRAVVVGDSASDIQMARAAGIRAIGALWGGAIRERLVDAGAELLLAEPSDLLAHLG
jgi:HAD superfamily hydrolase (TIGR01509 family)